MRGFKDSNNKFHPITSSKGVRKSRDQSTRFGMGIVTYKLTTKDKILNELDWYHKIDVTKYDIHRINVLLIDRIANVVHGVSNKKLSNIKFSEYERKKRDFDPLPSIMKPKTIKEFNTMTLNEATDFKKALGMEGVSIDFMDHRSKEYERLDKLHWNNVRNLSDSKWGSAVQDELQRRQMEKQ